MDSQNWYFEQLVDVDNMDAIETAAHAGIKDIIVCLQEKGVISGCGISQSTPSPSLAVLVQPGKLALEDGSIVVVGATRTLDLSSFVPATSGQSVWLTVWGTPVESSDTPVVTPSGSTLNYHLFDDVLYTVIAGVADFGTPAKSNTPPVGFVGTLIGDILLPSGTTVILGTAVDLTRQARFAPIGNLQAEIDAINVSLASTNAIMGALSSLMSTLQAQVNTIGTQTGANTFNISSIAAAITAIQAAIAVINGTTIPNLNTTLGALIAANTSDISTAEGHITTLDSEVAALAFTDSLLANGWYQFPGGLILQWTTGTTDNTHSTVSQSGTWPRPFPATILVAGVFTNYVEEDPTDSDIIMYQLTAKSNAGYSVRRARGGSYAANLESSPMIIALGF